MRLNERNGAEWVHFILRHGWRASGSDLAHVLGRGRADVERVRRTAACKPLPMPMGFNELFSLWNGRAPQEQEWPKPRRFPKQGTYEWQEPEIALLASLVGRLSVANIADALTRRLRQVTGDSAAARSLAAVLVRINQIGLQTTDVVGGITITQAGRDIGSNAVIHHAIHAKQIRARRVGKHWVIPHEEWSAWKATRDTPPEGYVPLASVREALAIRSDKLSEFARAGLIPTAIRCRGVRGPSTQYGTWHIDQKIAQQLVADRHAGRPMPWHGAPLLGNLKATFKRWVARRHPTSCKTCSDIWGVAGAPESLEAFIEMYPPLAHGAKRHLTMKWDPGLTIVQVAASSGCTEHDVRRAIENGALATRQLRKRHYISRTDATRWKARKCPTGDAQKSWMSLATASKQYGFARDELRHYIDSGRLKTKIGTKGAMRGIEYVPRHQCAMLREEIGFTERQAARRASVSVSQLRKLLEGVNWRKTQRITLTTLQAVIKRVRSCEGYTVEQAASAVEEGVEWVEDRIRDGTVKVSRTKWDEQRRYISAPMLRRLERAKKEPRPQQRLDSEWLRLGDAAAEAGVTTATILKWAKSGDLGRQRSSTGWRYHRAAIRKQARHYWSSVRFHRATPPAWLRPEQGGCLT
jgi:hypothetical protein